MPNYSIYNAYQPYSPKTCLFCQPGLHGANSFLLLEVPAIILVTCGENQILLIHPVKIP
jgi:hypothetical protein